MSDKQRETIMRIHRFLFKKSPKPNQKVIKNVR